MLVWQPRLFSLLRTKEEVSGRVSNVEKWDTLKGDAQNKEVQKAPETANTQNSLAFALDARRGIAGPMSVGQ